MQVERAGGATFRLTAHAYELATMVSACRWVVDHRPDDLPADALDQIGAVLASYDRAMERVDRPAHPR